MKLIFLLISFSLLKIVWSIDPILETLIDDFIDNTFLPSSNVPGIGLSIVQNGEIVLSKGYGFRNLEENLEVNNKTLFSIGSVSKRQKKFSSMYDPNFFKLERYFVSNKTVLATLVVKVLSEKFPDLGQNVLETPISRLAPGFNFSFSDRYRAENVAFRDLLAHKMCLYDIGVSLLVGAAKSSQEFDYRLRYQEEVCPFRMGSFVYSNSMYGFIGELIAHIAGESFEDLTIRFMREIGMEDARFMSSDGDHEILPDLARGYYWKDDKNQPFNMTLTRRISVCQGAGAILATMTDMGHFMNFHLNFGRVGDRQIIRPEVLNWMYDVSSIPGPFFADKKDEAQPVTGVFGYGLGIVLGLYDGWKWLQHGGFYPPYRSKISIFPAKNISIFTSANQETSDNMFPQDVIHLAVFEALRSNLNTSTNALIVPRLFEEDFKFDAIETSSWNLKVKGPRMSLSKDIFSNTDSQPVIEQSSLAGIYGSAQDGELEIVFDEVSSLLGIRYGQWGIGTLKNNGSNSQFVIEWETDINHHFYSSSRFTPDFYAEFSQPDILRLEIVEGLIATFVKNATLDTFSPQPWAPDSCGPTLD